MPPTAKLASYHGMQYVALHRDLGWAELAPCGVWRLPLFEFASKVHAELAVVVWTKPSINTVGSCCQLATPTLEKCICLFVTPERVRLIIRLFQYVFFSQNNIFLSQQISQ
jgi:hypothetical protein